MASFVFTITLLLGILNLSFAHYGQYVVETRFVFDFKAAENMARIMNGRISQAMEMMKFDANLLINEVNKYYKSLEKYGVNIEIRPKKIEFMTENIFIDDSSNFYNTSYLKINQVVPSLHMWLETTDKDQYDAVVFMTGYNLWSGYYKVDGKSLGKVCEDVNSLTMLSYNGTQKSAILIAHELGHSLGMPHDDIALCENAPDVGGYIMDTGGKDLQRYDFSECSAQNAEWKLSVLDWGELIPQCLKETTTKPHTFNYKQLRKTRMAHIYHRYYICRRALQTQSAYFCPKVNGTLWDRGDNLCHEIYCKTSSGQCQPFLPTEGMPCSGKGFDFSKICHRGKCITDV